MAIPKDHFLDSELLIYRFLESPALEFSYVYVPAFSDSVDRTLLSLV